MRRRLPPLNALRAFESAARNLSFTKAAEELNVTQAAISHQVKGLEDWFGIPLFRRMNRALLLTDAGQMLLPSVSEGFDRLAAGVMSLDRWGEEGVLEVTTLDSFASIWLVPRLGKFRALHPDIDVRVTISDHVMDLGLRGIDVGIRYGKGSWPNVEVTPFMDEELFPVCSPGFLTQHRLSDPADLCNVTLLHDDMPVDWEDWLAAAGYPDVPSVRGPGFTHSNLVLISATAGEGVALGRSVLVAEDLKAGRLVKPFDFSLPAGDSYYIITPKGVPDPPKVTAFKAWLIDEAQSGSYP